MASTAAVQDGWMARAALRSAAWAEKWFPDAYVFAVLGVVIVALAAMECVWLIRRVGLPQQELDRHGRDDPAQARAVFGGMFRRMRGGFCTLVSTEPPGQRLAVHGANLEAIAAVGAVAAVRAA